MLGGLLGGGETSTEVSDTNQQMTSTTREAQYAPTKEGFYSANSYLNNLPGVLTNMLQGQQNQVKPFLDSSTAATNEFNRLSGLNYTTNQGTVSSFQRLQNDFSQLLQDVQAPQAFNSKYGQADLSRRLKDFQDRIAVIGDVSDPQSKLMLSKFNTTLTSMQDNLAKGKYEIVANTAQQIAPAKNEFNKLMELNNSSAMPGARSTSYIDPKTGKREFLVDRNGGVLGEAGGQKRFEEYQRQADLNRLGINLDANGNVITTGSSSSGSSSNIDPTMLSDLNYLNSALDSIDAASYDQLSPDEILDELKKTPGYNNMLQTGMESAQSSAAAKGGVLSGNTLRALQKVGGDTAESTYNSTLARLGTQGQTAAPYMQGVNQTTTNMTSLLSSLFGQQSNNLASSTNTWDMSPWTNQTQSSTTSHSEGKKEKQGDGLGTVLGAWLGRK